MKKFIAIVAVVVSLTACNSGSDTTSPATNDSTVIKADTTLVVDSTTVSHVSGDSAK